MTSKLGPSPRISASAYLLFYRRRSEKPLGPQYLQDLVADFRNPPQQNNSADEAYESDSGEGRLGDPSSILRGSSSNSTGAGVAATTGRQLQAQTTLQGAGNGSTGQQAGQNLKSRTLGTSDDEGISMDDAPRQYGNIGTSSWSFDALGHDKNADSDAEMLLDRVDGDADSTVAEQDSDTDANWTNMNMDDDEGFYLGAGDTMADDYEQDDHTMYSNTRNADAQVDSLHLEDTAMMSDDPPAVDITLPDDPHAKMD